MSTFTDLAEETLVHAKALDAYLLSQNKPPASFQHDNLASLPSAIAPHREGLINASQTLKQLAQGPSGILTEATWACADEISLGAIYDHQLTRHVPLEGGTTFAEIAQASGLDEGLVERILRHAMALRVFAEEPTVGVCHTATSRQLATDLDMNNMLGVMLRETWPVAGKTSEAIRRYRGSQEPGDAAFGLVHDPGVPMFQYLAKYPERLSRFDGAMKYFARSDAWNLKFLVEGYDWSGIDSMGSTFVDVGGGQGAVALAIAEVTKHMKFVVQDLTGNVEGGRKTLPERLKGRVEFMDHDLFQEQPVKGAQVYFFRWILHDWSDKYALKILRSLLPAMRDGSRVVLYEWLLADGPETRWTEKQAR